MQHKAKTKNPLLTASPIKGLLMVSCVSYKKIKFFSVVRSCLVKGSRGSSDLLGVAVQVYSCHDHSSSVLFYMYISMKRLKMGGQRRSKVI